MQTDTTNTWHNEQPRSGTITISQLPGPPGIPLLGNVLQISTEKLHRIVERWSDQYGSIFRINMGTVTVVVITAPSAIQYVLKNRPDKFRRMGKMDAIIREMGVNGVFNAEGEEWKRQRKVVSQALNMQHIKSFFPSLVHITEKLLKRWNGLSQAEASIDIKSELMRYTVDITSQLAFGYNMNTIEKKEDIIQHHLEIIFPSVFRRINAPIPYWRFLKLPADRKLDRSLKVINNAMQKVIDQTRAQLAEHPELKQHPANFLQALLAEADQENPVPNEVIIGNVLTILMAGEDTTAHTLSWIFYYMHLFPAVQQKMQQEADLVLGSANTLKNYDDTTKLQYIEAVALEAIRLKPVSPTLFHDALEDVVIEGIEIPKGTGLFLQTQHAAVKEVNFSNAEDFIPERWMEGGCPGHKAHNEKAFLPFGGGPRFCPGYHLAMLEIKAVLSMVCKNFVVTMETAPESVHEILAFTMMPSNFQVRLARRKSSYPEAASPGSTSARNP